MRWQLGQPPLSLLGLELLSAPRSDAIDLGVRYPRRRRVLLKEWREIESAEPAWREVADAADTVPVPRRKSA